MEHRGMKRMLYLAAMAVWASCCACAQEAEGIKSIPLNLEAGFGAGTQKDGRMPFMANLDLSYDILRNVSIHAVSQVSYYMPKNGSTMKHNKETSLGGGVACVLFPSEKSIKGDFEARASVTATVGSSDFKNTAYSIGLYWHGDTRKWNLTPVIGVGYTLRDFSKKGMDNYQGMFVSIGVRL